jgi:hypothetical protein
MKKRMKKNKISHGRNLALTIILGVFISIMVVTLFNLIVGYAYPNPEYSDFCSDVMFRESYPAKIAENTNTCCNFSKSLQEEQDECYSQQGQPVFEYDIHGCASALKKCDTCNKEFNDRLKSYNRETFFVFAAIGFLLIVLGLFINLLLIQLIMLPAGAFLVIESGIKNFDDKLYVIIVFSLLIIAAVYLALKKLGNFK